MTKFTFAQAEEGFDLHIDQSVRGYSNLWSDILKSPERWDEQAETCRGIDKGKFWSKKEIKTQLDANTKIPMKAEPSP